MSRATLTLEDAPDGRITISVSFGDRADRTSPAHQMALAALEAITAQLGASSRSGGRVVEAAKACT